MENDQDCSANSCESFAWWDHDTLSLKTYQRCFLEGWTEYSGRLPPTGMMQSGTLYQRKAWEHRTEETECLSSPTWPTPTSRDYKNTGCLDNVPENAC